MSSSIGLWGVPLAMLAGAIRVSTPFLFVSVGECLTERSGRINLGLEGTLVMGAMSSYGTALASGSPWLGVGVAAGVGLLLGAMHAGICQLPRVNDIATGIGLMLFCLKGLTVHHTWRTGALSFAFCSINVGLALMVLLSLLPVGLMQTWASVEHGTWYARSAEFMQTPTMDTLRWLRVVGDTIFAVGVVALGWFVLGLKTGWSIAPGPDAVALEFPQEAAAVR